MYIVQLEYEGEWHEFCPRDSLDEAQMDADCWGAIYGVRSRVILDGEVVYGGI